MRSLKIEATRSTPMVEFDAEKGVLRIEGESYPEDAAKFYQPVFEWLRNHLSESTGQLAVELKVSYLNTSSSKCMMTLLDKLEEANGHGKRIAVTWRYAAGNEMAQECGKELSEDLKLPFHIIEEKE
jgi:hypothetical protein